MVEGTYPRGRETMGRTIKFVTALAMEKHVRKQARPSGRMVLGNVKFPVNQYAGTSNTSLRLTDSETTLFTVKKPNETL